MSGVLLAPLALLVPLAAWYLLAPLGRLFGRSRAGLMRFCVGLLVVAAVLTLVGSGQPLPARLAWTVAWLAAAALGVRLLTGHGLPRPAWTPDRLRRLPGLSRVGPAVKRRPHPQELMLLAERRIGRPVDAAARLRLNTDRGQRNVVLALSSGYLWWLELHPWRTRVGRIEQYRPVNGLAAHTERRRGGRQRIELSWPAVGELFVGTLHGAEADHFAGQLAAQMFTRSQPGAQPQQRPGA